MISAPSIADLLLSADSCTEQPHVSFTLPSGTMLVIPRKGTLRRRALAIYKPYRMTGLAAIGLMWTGLWRGQSVGVKRDALEELQKILADCLGEHHVECAFQFGATGIYSKTVILIMDSGGRTLAYAKLAAGELAQKALSYESSVLKKFANISDLRDGAPRLLAQTEWRSFPLTVISAGPPYLGPRVFSGTHRDYLARVRNATLNPGLLIESSMWHLMKRSLSQWRGTLSHQWQDRYDWAFAELEARLGRTRLDLSLAHRDFAPWNIRQHREGSLFVFDWEFSKEGSTPAWDLFHFHVASQAAFNRALDHDDVRNLIGEARRYGIEPADDLLLAYLLDVALFHHEFTLSVGESQHRILTSAAQGLDLIRMSRT
jgi:hypothetical protein